MIKFIFFDIDDTLFPSTEFSTLARKNALNAMISMGIKAEYPKLDAELSKIVKAKGSNYQNHFDILCRRLHVKEPSRYVAAAIAAYHDTKTAIQPFPRVPGTLLHLREEGYRLYVATNGNAVKQWDKLIRLRIAQYFDRVYVSEEVGREKDTVFFKKVLKGLGAKPSECMMVGDREEVDIEPCREIGMRTVRVLEGKYAKKPTRADFKIHDLSELLKIAKRI